MKIIDLYNYFKNINAYGTKSRKYEMVCNEK